jgi:branched-chain amino acid transport system substrate-binding protein
MNRNKINLFNRRIARWTFLKYLLVIGASAALIGFPGIIGAQEKEIKVASLNPLTGPLGTFGITNANGISFAVQEINSLGGIKSLGGAKIKLIRYDTESSPEKGVNVTERAISEGVVAIIGTTGSAICLAATTNAERYGVPMIVPDATHPEITKRGYKYIFRIGAEQNTLTKYDMEFITNLIDKKTGRKIKTLGILHEDGPYGQNYARMLKNLAEPHGITVSPILSYPKTASDFSPLILKLKVTAPDFVYCATYFDDAVLMTNQFKELKFMPMGICITGGTLFDDYITALGKTSDYIFGNRAWSPFMKIQGVPKERLEKLNAKWKSIYKMDMDGMAMYGFVAVYVLKDALERAASTDREKIRDALAKTDLAGTIQPCKNGKIQFDETGENKNAVYFNVQFVHGRPEIVWPREFATMEAAFPAPKWEERK